MTSPTLRLWAWPLALGLLTATGLLSALVSDVWGDYWSWLALGLPVAVMAWYGLRRPASRAEAETAQASEQLLERPSC